jgi:hypothetical protein
MFMVAGRSKTKQPPVDPGRGGMPRLDTCRGGKPHRSAPPAGAQTSKILGRQAQSLG